MNPIRTAIGRELPGGRFWRSRAAWIGIAVLGAFLFAACTNNGTVVETEPTQGSNSPPAARSEDAAPDFELALFENENHTRGEILRLSGLEGRPTVVNFWFPSCPPCVAEMPDLEASFQAHKEQGVEFVGIEFLGVDTIEDGQKFVDELGVTYALGPDEDGNIVVEYKVISFPTTFFLDENHNIVRKWAGPLNSEKLNELIQEILN